MQEPVETRTRPQVIADAAVHLIATEGLRALTHRAVDTAAGLPQGSTSYYAQTRAALLELVAHRLAERSLADLRTLFGALAAAQPESDPRAQDEQLTELLAAFAGRLVDRSDDMRARYALVVDFVDREPLRGILTSRSPLLGEGLTIAQGAFSRLGFDLTSSQLQDLFVLVDSLVFAMTVRGGAEPLGFDPSAIIAAHLRGVRAGLG